MKPYTKRKLPTEKIRRLLEPGPVVLLSSAYKDEQDIMTMGWHTVMEFSPSLIGCVISSANHSYELVKKSKECVINIPSADLLHKVVGIGNCSGTDVNKFRKFDLTAEKGIRVSAPVIKECYANFECRLYDSKLIKTYNFFIWEVIEAKVAVSPKFPKTIHYTGDGVFMLSGNHINLKKEFKREGL